MSLGVINHGMSLFVLYHDPMIVGFKTTSVPITTDVVSSNLDQGHVYNIM
jgi:hypothetical protein